MFRWSRKDDTDDVCPFAIFFGPLDLTGVDHLVIPALKMIKLAFESIKLDPGKSPQTS